LISKSLSYFTFVGLCFAAEAAAAGANVIVAGTSIFCVPDSKAAIAEFRAAVDAAIQQRSA
jgi:pentose-5-phosphate-3-epimerase